MLKLAAPFTNRLRARLRRLEALSGGRESQESFQAAEFARCKASAEYFINNYLIIDDTQGDSDGGTMPFTLWPAQREALAWLVAEREVIFLKARQLGISWLCLGYALWLMYFHAGKPVLLFSQGETESGEMLRRLKVMYERLPAWFKALGPARTRDNASEQGWANQSRCRCMPATQKAGRSFTAALVILDEAAFQQYGGKLYNSIRATVAKGNAQLFVVSTANGSDGFFDRLWRKSAAGLNTFKAIFLPWHAEPSRDQAWYDAQVASSVDPDLVKQEFPNDPIEAFVSSGRTRFRPSWVAAQLKHALPPVPESEYGHLRGMADFHGLVVYELVQPGHRYIVAADPAQGKEDGDASDCTVFDRDTLAEVACFNGQWEPDEFARRLHRVAEYYNAGIIVEKNNHGHAVLLRLSDLCPDRILNGLDGEWGWVTTAQNKAQIIDLMAARLRDDTIAIRSPAALGEFEVYQVLNDGKTGAPAGSHDDRVMSRAILLGWLTLAVPVLNSRPLMRGPSPVAGHRG